MFNNFKILITTFLSFFILIHSVSFSADAVFVVNSTKHSEWELDKHWIEIKTSDNKVYQSFLLVTELQEIQSLKGEEIIIHNEQILFSRFGYSSFDLFIPSLNRTLIGEGISTIAHLPKGKEAHAIFEVYANPMEKSLSFKIENGEKFKLFFGDEHELESWQSGQEIEIFYEEPLYEKDPLRLLGIKNDEGPLYENVPLLLLGIKNLETNNEYLVKADAYQRWQPKREDFYRVMTLEHRSIEENEYSPARNFDELSTDEGKYYMMWGRTTGNNDDKVMVLEHIEDRKELFGRVLHLYKLLNLRTGEVYLQYTADPSFHAIFNTPFQVNN